MLTARMNYVKTSQTIIYFVGVGLYNVYLHPLSRYPGPRLAAATSLYFGYWIAEGLAPHHLLELHNRYGEVVRVGPNDLTYINPEAWNDIYAHRSGRQELRKDPRVHDKMGDIPSIINANTEKHASLRKMLSPGFSDKALRDQEPVIQQYVDLLVRRLEEESMDGNKSMDIAAWFNVSQK
jgi:cytochrome P450